MQTRAEPGLVCARADAHARAAMFALAEPLHAIDVRVVHNASQDPSLPHICADGAALSRGGSWGDVRLCVAQFLANLWHGPLLGHVWHEGQSHRPAALRQKR
jgi:hypothetical protein